MTSLSNKKIILTVVRHGQTNGNKESILQGQNGAKVFLNSHLEILSIHKVIWRIYSMRTLKLVQQFFTSFEY